MALHFFPHEKLRLPDKGFQAGMWRLQPALESQPLVLKYPVHCEFHASIT